MSLSGIRNFCIRVLADESSGGYEVRIGDSGAEDSMKEVLEYREVYVGKRGNAEAELIRLVLELISDYIGRMEVSEGRVWEN